ncbi:DinB family protein [Aggregatilineales bacterium SYSU G02658]
MSERVEQLKSALSHARAVLLEAIEKIGDRGEEQLYSDGAAWTLRQLTIHLLLSERGIIHVIQRAYAGENPITPDYDVDRYNQRSVEKNANMTIAEAVAGLHEARQAYLAWLDTVEDAKLDTVNRHPLQDEIPLWQFIERQALHERMHAQDIVRHLQG